MTGAAVVKKITSAASISVAGLGEILHPVWKLLTYSADNFAFPEYSFCICIEKGALSAAYGSRFLSLVKIKGTKEYQYEGYPQPAETASSAVLAVSELRAEKAAVTLSLPKEWTVIRTAVLPLAVRENLSDVISNEMDRLTPFSADDTLYDFRVLDEDDKNLTILLAAVKADLVNGYIEALRTRNIIVNRVTLNLSGLGSLLGHIDGNKDFIFMETNSNKYEGALFVNGVLREAITGDFAGRDEGSNTDTVMAEITRSSDLFIKAGRTPQVLFSLKDMSSSFVELLKLKAEIPFKLLHESRIQLRVPGAAASLPYYAVGGALEGLSHEAGGLNLLSKGTHPGQKTPPVLTAALLLIIASLGVLSIFLPLKTEEKRLAIIDSELSLRKKEVTKFEWLDKEIKAVEKEISDIKSFGESRQPTIDIIKEITSALPQDAWLTRIHISETTAEIEGYAGSATGLLPKLEASKFFHKVKFATQTFRDVKKGVDRFRIHMEIESATKAEPVKKEGGEGLTDEGF
ncbi:MAG: hypothetical protein C4526_00725 [Nitrospiraceae bacterium]|nr:MAG: hypothetical protein C4526_00725 [Nitrospiraceae bacterium]